MHSTKTHKERPMSYRTNNPSQSNLVKIELVCRPALYLFRISSLGWASVLVNSDTIPIKSLLYTPLDPSIIGRPERRRWFYSKSIGERSWIYRNIKIPNHTSAGPSSLRLCLPKNVISSCFLLPRSDLPSAALKSTMYLAYQINYQTASELTRSHLRTNPRTASESVAIQKIACESTPEQTLNGYHTANSLCRSAPGRHGDRLPRSSKSTAMQQIACKSAPEQPPSGLRSEMPWSDFQTGAEPARKKQRNQLPDALQIGYRAVGAFKSALK